MSSIARITPDALEAMLGSCLASPLEECCGIAACRLDDPLRIVTAVLPVPNGHADSGSRYAFGPERWVALFYRMRREGLDAAGIYHSHPRTPAFPSDLDRSHPLWTCSGADEPSGSAGGLVMWIVSLMAERPDIAAFRPSQAGLRKLMLAEVRI
ncbi:MULTISPECIES: M67 family metallopeptidase [unclassified Paenibacillus]|uniref:Mov34/MPN/PAD-1 family protein n=1 Tax=unclassified Paenibacillus TaxID=185978 RepID=UPI000956D6E2|nr:MULTISPECIES: M67 family metallopeptidase [unclassified Paenibacillus]ASS64879.2 M67 family metallopeptidase [Paenibacillus sp. RUD330]SIR02904.1 JAB domain-containing protein [Paenibacillus sp. RU4X]SIR32420.1 JAB domain-containing protein [Paenibacillus sp. RU4T]